jgi:uncharacterized membrane protein
MKLTLDKTDKIWEAISILLILINFLMIAITLPALPETVPIHFDGSGQPNGWGNKQWLWLAVVLELPIYALLTLISLRPWIYKFRMTEKNPDEQYRLTSRMARTVKAFVLLAFTALTILMLKTAQGQWNSKIPLLVLIFFGLIIPPCVYYSVKISRVQQ